MDSFNYHFTHQMLGRIPRILTPYISSHVFSPLSIPKSWMPIGHTGSQYDCWHCIFQLRCQVSWAKDSERLGHLPKVIQLVWDRARAEPKSRASCPACFLWYSMPPWAHLQTQNLPWPAKIVILGRRSSIQHLWARSIPGPWPLAPLSSSPTF